MAIIVKFPALCDKVDAIVAKQSLLVAYQSLHENDLLPRP